MAQQSRGGKALIPELNAIILACRVFLQTAQKEELNRYLKAQKIDWQIFYELSRAHGVRLIVSKTLTECGIECPVSDKLMVASRSLTLKNYDHLREVLQLNVLFQKAGITALPYKGISLACQFYDDIGLRESSDIDYLLNPRSADIATITEIMTDLGYSAGFEAPAEFRDFYFKHIREFKFTKYEGEKRKALVEFHTSLSDPELETGSPVTNEYLFADAYDATLMGNAIKMLRPTRHFIAMITHHGMREQWASLKYMVDVAMAVKSGKIDWQSVFACSDTYRFRKTLEIGLQLTNELMGVSPKQNCRYSYELTPWLQKVSCRHLRPADRTWRNNFKLRLKSKDSFSDKCRFISSHIAHIATPSLLDYQLVRLPRPLYFLYIFIKPVRLLRRST